MSTVEMARSEFVFKISYFKLSGKYYTETEYKAIIRKTETGVAYMPDIAAKIRGIRDSRAQDDPLPGLCGNGWEGFILIECEEGFPVLVVPSTSKDV